MDKEYAEDLTESASDASSFASSFDGDDSSEEYGSPSSSSCSVEEAHADDTAPPLGPPTVTAGQLSPKRVPKPKVPALGLSLDLSRGLGSATPRGQPDSARRKPAFAIPRLPVAGLQSGSEAGCERPAPEEPLAVTRRESAADANMPLSLRQLGEPPDRCDGGQCLDVPASTVSVALLSPAFMLDRKHSSPQGLSMPARALSRVGKALGVQQQELKLYEVREVGDPAQLGSDANVFAVAVQSSDFSLSALERLLADNKRLRSEAAVASAGLDSAGMHSQEEAEALADARMGGNSSGSAVREGKLRQALERCCSLENEVIVLREQLKRSTALRVRGQRALDELKAEFEVITKDLVSDAVATLTVPSLASPVSEMSTPEALKTPNMSSRNSRIADVLEKLCDDAVLLRLEQCFSKAGP